MSASSKFGVAWIDLALATLKEGFLDFEGAFMNTANLQLAGVYATLAALISIMRDKKLLTETELERLLAGVEGSLMADPLRPVEFSHANVDAICFPTRFLRLALQAASEGEQPSFAQLAARVGLTKPDHDQAALPLV
ncbi:MAG: hypothetical protein ACYC5H_10700 [Methylovirgula sp.]